MVPAPLPTYAYNPSELHAHVIMNPKAGKGRAPHRWQQVRQALQKNSVSYTLHVTSAPQDATRITQALPLDALVMPLGGDGTLHEVALAACNTARTLHVLPAGSGDDFAYALGIPTLAASLELMQTGTVQQVDMAVANGVPFVNALGTGFDAEVGAWQQRAPRWLQARGSYIYGLGRSWGHIKGYIVTVEVDGQEVFQGRALLIGIYNGLRAGGGFYFAPHASICNGMVEVVIAGALSQMQVMRVLPKVLKARKTPLQHPHIHYTQGETVRICWQHARPMHTDGELHSPQHQIDTRVLPGALRVVVPKDYLCMGG